MTDLQKLEDLYTKNVKIDDEIQSYYRGLLRYLEHDLLVPEMKRANKDFANLYQTNYYGGSYFDGLKVGSSSQEFDLGILFQLPKDRCQIVKLGQDPTKKNFAGLLVSAKPWLPGNESEKEIMFKEDGDSFLSPEKMFGLLQRSVDRALTNIGGQFYYKGQQFKISRSVSAPVTLNAISVSSIPGSSQEITMEVDFVPAFQFDDIKILPAELKERIVKMSHNTVGAKNFMAFALPILDKKKFQLDFHDLERKILYNRGCAKKVIMLLKYMRDVKGGPMAKLWSHLIKTSMMHKVLEQPRDYWRDENLPNCFIDSIQNLADGLKCGRIADVFFPEVNLLDRIKSPDVLEDVKRFLERKLDAYKQTGDILTFV